MHITLRSISEVDFEFIYEVTRVTMQTYVEQTWGNWVDFEQRTIIYDSINLSTHQIIQLDGQDVGCLAVEIHPSYMQLTKLYVLPNFQRRGIGTVLIRRNSPGRAVSIIPLTCMIMVMF